MTYGSTFPVWRAAAGNHWHAYTHHAFVEGLSDGTLPRESFLHYLVQDYLYLVHFARAWALAMTKAETLEEMRHCAATTQALIDDELRLHTRICAEAGIAESTLQSAEERPATLAYTRYVLDAGHAGGFLDLMAALAPCVMGYGEIGARLLASDPAPDYADWIETYGGGDYQELCSRVGTLIDEAVRLRLGEGVEASPSWPRLCQRFTTATRLEVGFWDMGLDP